jgi:class 3 adenylate cyclase/tetratricopeptide (TPR) repeat protein
MEPSRTSVRRFVTVLRTDVQGSTDLGARHDPELVGRVMKRYHHTARVMCANHGGVIEQVQGDAVVAIFEGHEDDPLRAVRAAAELREAMARLNEELEREARVRLPIRTAVSSGEVVGGDGPGTLSGDVMNVIAHLEKEARPGEILLGESTVQLIGEAAAVEQAGPFALKGKREPVRAYRLLVVLPEATGRARPAPPMVGRTHERAMVTAAYERAVATRCCHLVTVLGPAGVGKSRLVEELLDSVRERATVLAAGCPSYGGVAYDAIIQVIAEAAGREPSDRAAMLDWVAELVTGVDGADRIVQRVGQVLGLRKGAGPPMDTHWALRRLLEVLARERPLVVVLDDLHWADPALLDLVEDLAEASRDAPLLIICMARLELLDVRKRWGGGKVNAVTIQLGPLAAGQGRQLVRYVLAGLEIAPEAERYVLDWSGGNPLFVQSLLTMLRDRRLLTVDSRRWQEVVKDLEPPRDIQAVVGANLHHLGVAERRTLERAAVIGLRFTEAAVVELSPDEERPTVRDHLLALVRKGFIAPDPHSVAGADARYAFEQNPFQEVTYNLIAKETRAELHERFAEWLPRRSGAQLVQTDEVVGRHLQMAYRNLVDVGRLDRRTAHLARRAGEALAAAGHRAAARRDIPGPAVELLGRAEVLLDRNDELRRGVLLDLGDALQDNRSPQEALEAYGKAIEAAEAAGDVRRATHGALGILEVRGFLGQEGEPPASQPDVVTDAVRLFNELGDLRGLAKAWRAKAYDYWTTGRLTRAAGASRRAIGFARRAADEQLEAEALSSRCFILFWGPRHVSEVTNDVQETLQWARSRGLRRLEADALRILARIAAMQRRFPEARALLREADRAEPKAADLLVLVGAYLSAGIVELMADEAVAAEHILREGHKEVARLQGTRQLASVAILLARSLVAQGRDDEAMERIKESQRAAHPSQLDAQILAPSIRAVLLARRGDVETAEGLAAAAVRRTESWEQLDSTAEVLADHAAVLRLAGREPQARRQAQRALDLYRRKGNLVGAGAVEAFLGRDRPA